MNSKFKDYGYNNLPFLLEKLKIRKGENFSKLGKGIREPEVKYSSQDFIKKGDVVYDVGAHIGELTIFFSKLVGKKGKIFSFEPNKILLKFLEESLNKSNSNHNTKIINKAVSNISKKNLDFYIDLDPGSWGSSLGKHQFKISKEYKRDYKSVKVDSITLDEFFFKNQKGKNPPKFIKIDVEEFEIEVLKGCSKIIDLYRPYFLFEYRHLVQEFEKDPLIFLEKKGYKFYDCSLYKRIDKSFYINRNSRSDLWQNIIAVHKDSIDPWKNLYIFPNTANFSHENERFQRKNKFFSHFRSLLGNNKPNKLRSFKLIKNNGNCSDINDYFIIKRNRIKFFENFIYRKYNEFELIVKKIDLPKSYLDRYRLYIEISECFPHQGIELLIIDLKKEQLITSSRSPSYYYFYSTCYQNLIFDVKNRRGPFKIILRSGGKNFIGLTKLIIYSINQIKSPINQ
jgi:FkbM family methyltransferase